MRKAEKPKKKDIFQHKTNKELFARELYLAEGESIDAWEEITEAEYAAIVAERERVAAEMMSR